MAFLGPGITLRFLKSTDMTELSDTTCHRVERTTLDGYNAILKEPYRPPSQGGNTSAMYQHRLRIGGDIYVFLARGSRKWVYKGDTVSFDWQPDPSGKLRNILLDSFETWNGSGRPVVRGDRRAKPQWRTAPTPLLTVWREQRN
jgi:hypothetical protein